MDGHHKKRVEIEKAQNFVSIFFCFIKIWATSVWKVLACKSHMYVRVPRWIYFQHFFYEGQLQRQFWHILGFIMISNCGNLYKWLDKIREESKILNLSRDVPQYLKWNSRAFPPIFRSLYQCWHLKSSKSLENRVTLVTENGTIAHTFY